MVFHVKTREGIKLQFIPNKKGLHVLDFKYYFEVGKDNRVFGKEISVPTVEEEYGMEAITTVEDNKKNFTKQDVSWAEVAYFFFSMGLVT